MTRRARRLFQPALRAKSPERNRAATWPARRRSVRRLPSGPRKKESRRWWLTVGDLSATEASRRWRMPRAKQVWSSKYNGDSNKKKARCRQLPVERPGGGHQPRDQGGQGRKE